MILRSVALFFRVAELDTIINNKSEAATKWNESLETDRSVCTVLGLLGLHTRPDYIIHSC